MEGRLRTALIVAWAAFAATGCGGGSEHRSNRALDPANELPFGRIDTPVDGAQVASVVTIGGWALDDRGIAEVRVYVDSHVANTSPINTERPDVSKAFAAYARASNLHGWTMSIAFEAPGPHTIIAQAVDSDGATHDIGTLAVTSKN